LSPAEFCLFVIHHHRYCFGAAAVDAQRKGFLHSFMPSFFRIVK
jgi:hypothetical protein